MHLVREIRTYVKITTYPSRYCCTLAQGIVGFDLCKVLLHRSNKATDVLTLLSSL